MSFKSELEEAWRALLHDAGWSPDLNGSPNLRLRRAYEAKIDALCAERESGLRYLIARAKISERGDSLAYVTAIEGALERAITTPRQALPY